MIESKTANYRNDKKEVSGYWCIELLSCGTLCAFKESGITGREARKIEVECHLSKNGRFWQALVGLPHYCCLKVNDLPYHLINRRCWRVRSPEA